MKVIDLLNKIANGEIPEKIKYENYIYWYDKDLKDYENVQVEFRSYLINSRYHNTDFLNEEVEIIEDTPKEDKKIEKLPYYSLEKIQKAKNQEEWLEKRISLLEERINDYHNKTNEIIDKINGE